MQISQRLKNNPEAVRTFSREEFVELFSTNDPVIHSSIREYATYLARRKFQNGIYVRGLIEISNICKNDCYYCGIRKSNKDIGRYRLSREEILSSCLEGYGIGFRTFVLQGGEDYYWRGDRLVSLVEEIKGLYPDCGLTLSLGEMEYEEYESLIIAGANRYLLRHETYDEVHYQKLHPSEMSRGHRLQSLYHLKQLGYQVGTGIMVGSPYQTVENLADDILFIRSFQPHMIGIGPFLSHQSTPFCDKSSGDLNLTLLFVALCRIMCPDANIPATTAVATLNPKGRELAILSGANVVMPNLSPKRGRNLYTLYDNKVHSGSEAVEGVRQLAQQLDSFGYHINWDRGDFHNSDEKASNQ